MGLGSQKSEQEAQAIHKENLEKLRSMSEEEILQEQERLLAQLGMCFPGWILEMWKFTECVGVLKSYQIHRSKMRTWGSCSLHMWII